MSDTPIYVKKLKKQKDQAEKEEELETKKSLAKLELQRELMEALPNSQLAARKKQKRKKNFRNSIYIGIFLLFCYGVYWLVKPFQSSMAYGICKVFVELYSPYPRTVYFSQVENFGSSIRIWFTKVDPFGEYRLEPIQCYYMPPENGQPYQLERVTIGRREVDPLIVERFNRSISVIVAHPPDLIFPTPLPDSLEGLQFDFESFRKQIL